MCNLDKHKMEHSCSDINLTMPEITIVTAFFDIGRSNWKGYKRNNQEYLEFFKFWARIRNKIVVYTDRETAKQVMNIRESFGLKDKTIVVVIDNIKQFDFEIYERIEKVLSDKLAVNFRKKPMCPESHNVLYNYLVTLKPQFVMDAVNCGYADGIISWIDFGYNHGGEFFTNPLEFDFLWKHSFSPKIHAFALNPLDDIPIFEIIRTMRTYFAGGIIVASAEFWKTLSESFRNSIVNLTSCGLIDDDQTLLVMAYREYPDIFEIHYIDDFYYPLKCYGGEHLSSVKLRQSFKSRKTAKGFFNNREYGQAFKWYMKYTSEKLRSL